METLFFFEISVFILKTLINCLFFKTNFKTTVIVKTMKYAITSAFKIEECDLRV